MLLNNLLTLEQQEAGLTVSEDEDFLCLQYKGLVLATWVSLNIKPPEIQREAETHLSEIRKHSQLVAAGI